MWRVQRDLPERGRIGVFNRSHYEEVLVVRVHPEYLDGQRLPRRPKDLDELWEERYESINDAEKHWARNGIVILKFFLNVSQKEQHKRFLDRIVDPGRQLEVQRRRLWPRASTGTTTWTRTRTRCARRASRGRRGTRSPPTRRRYMRRTVAEIVVDTLERVAPRVSPGLGRDGRPRSPRSRAALEAEKPSLVTAGREVDALLLAGLAAADQRGA